MSSSFKYEKLLRMAYEEDVPNGDITSSSILTGKEKITAQLRAKEDLVLSGTEVFEEAFKWLQPDVSIKWFFKDGDFVLDKQVLCQIQGYALAMLQAERVALNFMGRLSGISTLTRCFVEQMSGTQTKILDTRKTTPGFRQLEKKAVVHGGGQNHRMNLSDAILIKENHIRAAGSLAQAVNSARHHSTLKIEVECSNLKEIQEAVELRVDRIMLDNMNNETLKEALAIIPKIIETEASGNMTLDRVSSVARLGVDFISVGQLTHSAPCADISLIFDWNELK